MKHLWIYVVFLMVLHFQRIPASDVCFSNEQTSNCYCTSPPPEPFPDRPLFCVTCTVLVLEENVSSSCSPGTSVSYNQQCYFSCPTGYNLIGPSSVICTSSGSFSEPFPRCDEVTCTVHSLGAHVSSSCSPGTSVNYNDLCSFSCQTGFNIIGPSSVTCTGSGNFSEPFPRCVVTCTVPSLGANVSSSCSPNTSISSNEQCSFSCPNGYSRAGPSSVNCTGSGNFSEPFPRCVECDTNATLDCPETVITCTVPEFDELVSSCPTGEYVIYNQQCNFSCPTNYSRAGPSSVNCTGSGHFSQMFPHCVVITCTVPEFDELVSTCSTGEYVIYNHSCSFSCPTGYSLAGSSSVTCTGSGNFSEPFPQCEVGCTDENPCMNGGTYENSACTCAPGFTGSLCDEACNDSGGCKKDIDDCDFKPCLNGGTCVTDGVSSYTCTCDPDYTGTRCECGSNDSDWPETELGIIDVNLMSPGTSSGRRKRAAVPIESAVVQNLLDSIVIAVDRLPEVISVNGRAISANDDVIDFITARVRLDVTFGSDITIQQLTLLVIASINNIPGVDVQSFELLTDPCSLDTTCGNGDTCVRVEPGSANVTCTPDDDDDDDDGITTILAIALPIVFLLLVAICLLAFVYHRYGGIHGRKGRAITLEPLVQEGTSGAGLQQSSSSVGHQPSGDINPPLVNEFNDGLEMDSRLNSDEVDRHDAEVKGLSYRQTVDEHRATSGNRAKESDFNEVPQKELRV